MPCQKAGRSGAECGPIELPLSRRAKLPDPQALLGKWLAGDYLQPPPPAPHPEHRPEHGLDLLGDMGISLMVPPSTAQDFGVQGHTTDHNLGDPTIDVQELGSQEIYFDLNNFEVDPYFKIWLEENP